MKKFMMPIKSDLKSRTSTISNAFTISITPWLFPSNDELKEFYEKFDVSEGQCAYCLQNGANSIDHYKGLVIHSEPSGYITDIDNLVPCCSACNSSKGSKAFERWYDDERTKERLHKLGMTHDDIVERRHIIVTAMSKIKHYNFKEIIGGEKWDEFIRRRKAMNDLLKEDQLFCDELRKEITEYIINDRKNNQHAQPKKNLS